MITNAHMHIHAYTLIHTQYYDNFGMPDLQTTEIEQPELGKPDGKVERVNLAIRRVPQTVFTTKYGDMGGISMQTEYLRVTFMYPCWFIPKQALWCVSEKTVHNSLKIRSCSESAPQNYLRHNLSTWQSLPCSISRSVPRALLEIYNILCMHTLLCKNIGK